MREFACQFPACTTATEWFTMVGYLVHTYLGAVLAHGHGETAAENDGGETLQCPAPLLSSTAQVPLESVMRHRTRRRVPRGTRTVPRGAPSRRNVQTIRSSLFCHGQARIHCLLATVAFGLVLLLPGCLLCPSSRSRGSESRQLQPLSSACRAVYVPCTLYPYSAVTGLLALAAISCPKTRDKTAVVGVELVTKRRMVH